jgi:histidyl-tRNA synthetase
MKKTEVKNFVHVYCQALQLVFILQSANSELFHDFMRKVVERNLHFGANLSLLQAVVIGESEIAAGVVKIRDIETREEASRLGISRYHLSITLRELKFLKGIVTRDFRYCLGMAG